MEPLTPSNIKNSHSPYESAVMIYSNSIGPLALPHPHTRRRARTNVKAALAGLVLAVLLLASIGIIALYSYIAWILARPAVAPLASNPLAAVGLHYENIAFPSADDSTRLEGWYIPAAEPSDRTLIFSHGYGGNREEIWVPIYELARYGHEQGYNVLMFDYGYVYHADRVVTGGAKESRDLIGALDYAVSRGAKEKIVWGFSMGAGTALQAALQTDLIDGMILDSTFILEPDTLHHNLQQYGDLPREPSLTLLRWLYPLINGSGMDEVPYQQLKETVYEMPILFIHGTLDERSPYEIIRNLALNQNNSSDYWLVPGATHELVYRAEKEQYLQRTTAFLEQIPR